MSRNPARTRRATAWRPGAGRTPSSSEAQEHAEWVESSPETRYQPPKDTERFAVTGRAASPSGYHQPGMVADPNAMPEMRLEQHSDIPAPRQKRLETAAEVEAGGAPVSRLYRKAQFDVDKALTSGLSPDFYEKTARNQVGQLANRTGVNFQTAAATTAATSPQAPWMQGERETNIDRAEGEIESTIRDRGYGRQEKHRPHAGWDPLRDTDRDARFRDVLEPVARMETTQVVKDKAAAVVDFGMAGQDPVEARWGGMAGDEDKPVFGPGPKETSFYQNFRQPGNPNNRVTFDRHMSDSLVGRDRGDKFRQSIGRYRIGAEAYGRAADTAGVTREGGQAAAWTQVKADKGHTGGSYDESGEGLSAVERKQVADANPVMFKTRGDEVVPNEVKTGAPPHVPRDRAARKRRTG